MHIGMTAASAVLFSLAVTFGGTAFAKTSALDFVQAKVSESAKEDEKASKEEVEGSGEKAEEASAGDDAPKKHEKELEVEERVSGYAANPYSSLISAYAEANGVPEGLAHAVVRVESNFRPGATGAAGEIGLMQLKLSTARLMGYEGSAKALYDPETNIKYGMKYLGQARSLGDGSTCGTILKYNAGHGATSMNPISANYCNKVAALL
ncbi:lytic transglycosylase domain-containing protein [Pararhizobium haloflavum]|uniref:lytic transglycosylase domain-containing protein n=1 Tax=Pararhizobium haloflavum TaxID=2037914 RepID=UPI000C185BD0|nr:transglycosylase SLT domain-containing protein [Pararhizobium haloflavum]